MIIEAEKKETVINKEFSESFKKNIKNPMRESDGSEIEEFEYRPSNKYHQSKDDKKLSNSNNSNNSQKRSSSSNMRSTIPINPFYSDVIELIKSRNLKMIKEVLEEEPHKFYDSIDNMGKTILHYACEKNNFELVKTILQNLFAGAKMIASQNNKNEVTRMEFINKQNIDGLTAIHYSTFRGNIEIIRYLINHGGNPFIKDYDGHNVIHIAAQGDKVNAIYYFIKNFNFDVNDRDTKESSALHWAAYLNKEISLSYLVAWGANVNAQDLEKNTPLHLAVLTSEAIKETRWVKILLLKGAKRSLQNNEGLTARQLVKHGDMEKELHNILKEQSYWTWLMLKVPLTKINRNERTVAFFLFLFIGMNTVNWLFIMPVDENMTKIFSITFAVADLFLLISFALAALINPGYIVRDPNIDFQQLLDTTDPYNICPDCKIIRTPRSRHWNIWNAWVERFDHHWPYINNWVGYKNHAFFLAFILLLVINMALLLAATINAFINHEVVDDHFMWSWKFAQIDQTLKYVIVYTFCSFILIICAFFLPFTMILSWVHSCNFWKNKTTNERFSRKNDGDNNSTISRSIMESSNSKNENTSALIDSSQNDTLLRSTFMGPKDGTWIGNWFRMCLYKPPTQQKMRMEYM